MSVREPLSCRCNGIVVRPESDPIADHLRIYIERRQSMEGSMGTMTDFWAREWLLEDIALRHAINDLDTAIQIGQQAGLLTRLSNRCWPPLCKRQSCQRSCRCAGTLGRRPQKLLTYMRHAATA